VPPLVQRPLGNYVWLCPGARLENLVHDPVIGEAKVKTNRTMRRLTRGNPFLRERVHDPYRSGEKLRDATGCAQCGARYRNGRWTWPHDATGEFRQVLCPACRRSNDHYPAGELMLSGDFLPDHRDQILATIRRIAEQEQQAHPLHRIMSIDDEGDALTIATTDLHLPHRLAHALKDAFGGSISTHYDLEGYFTRALWERND
jgi:hypothetical protein